MAVSVTAWKPEYKWIERGIEDVASQKSLIKNKVLSYPGPPLYSEDSIRLLHLFPGSWKDNIECNLVAVSLDAQPPYEAISYTWGLSKADATICVNGQCGFPVTDNVSALLRRLRLSDRERVLWIDAICINQQDLVERAQQVKIMGLVYSQARKTLVWLGNTGARSGEDGRREDSQQDWRVLEEELDRAISTTSPYWWDRAWVLQELVLSTKVDVCFGAFQKPWGDFCWDHLKIDSSTERSKHSSTYSYSSTHLNPSPKRKHLRERFVAMDGLRTRIRVYSRLPFWDVLRYTIESEATDPRDKVYSILSIVGKEVASLVEPSYEAPSEEVFAKATHASIEAEQQFDPLYQVTLPRERTSKLPSWAVDFEHGHQFEFADVLRLGQEVRAQWTTQPSDRPLASISPDSKRLTVSGIILDEIVETKQLTTMLYEDSQHVVRSTLVSALHRVLTMDDYEDVVISAICPPKGRSSKQDMTSSEQSISAFASSCGSVQQLFRDAIGLWSEIVGVPQTSRADLIHENGLFLFWQYARSSAETATLFMTNSGFFGVAPDGVEDSDVVALLRGSRFPVILRQEEEAEEGEEEVYRFCGFAFVYGVMNGELMEMCNEDLFVEGEFILV